MFVCVLCIHVCTTNIEDLQGRHLVTISFKHFCRTMLITKAGQTFGVNAVSHSGSLSSTHLHSNPMNEMYTLFPSCLGEKVYTISATYISQLEALMSPTQSDIYIYMYYICVCMCMCIFTLEFTCVFVYGSICKAIATYVVTCNT